MTRNYITSTTKSTTPSTTQLFHLDCSNVVIIVSITVAIAVVLPNLNPNPVLSTLNNLTCGPNLVDGLHIGIVQVSFFISHAAGNKLEGNVLTK